MKLFLRDFCHLSNFFATLLMLSVIPAPNELLSGEISVYLITNRRAHCSSAFIIFLIFTAHLSDSQCFCLYVIKLDLVLKFLNFINFRLLFLCMKTSIFYIFQSIHSMCLCFLEANTQLLVWILHCSFRFPSEHKIYFLLSFIIPYSTRNLVLVFSF